MLRASYGRTLETPYNENLLLSSGIGLGGVFGDGQILELDVSNPSSLEQLLAAAKDEVAAVIVAPEMILPTRANVFFDLLATARRHGAVRMRSCVRARSRCGPKD